MTTTQTIFGQSDALALAVVDLLNDASAGKAFCLDLSASRVFARIMDLKAIPDSTSAVSVQVFPGHDQADRAGLSGPYDDTYGVHVVLQQRVGGVVETQCPLLMQLRTQITEFLAATRIDCPAAVHPFKNAHLFAHRTADNKGVYDLMRLEEFNAFYAEIVLTYKVPGLRR